MTSRLSACRRRLARTRDDSGFSLVETVVALAIAMVVFVAIAGVLIATTKASLLARQNQQSIDAASEAIETVRALNFAAVAMVPADLVGDDNLTPAGSSYTIDPDGDAGDLAAEEVHAEVGGGVNPHIREVLRNTTTFVVHTYVTKPPADGDAEYRRVTVLVRWTTGTRVRERRTSTVVTLTRRGLPLPKFDFGSAVPDQDVNASATFQLPFTVTNRGAPDRWNLTFSVSPAVTWTFTWRQDTNGNGQHDDGEPDFTDSTGDTDTTVDTGVIATDESVQGVLTATVPSLALPGLYTITLTATSSSQPSAATASQSFEDRINVIPLPTLCPGCTLTNYYLQNGANAATGNTPQRAAMVLTTTAPLATATTLYNFDRNKDSRAGRRVLAGGTGSGDTNADRSALWETTFGAPTTFGPTPGQSANITLSFWTQKTTAATGSVTYNAYVLRQTSGNNNSPMELAASGTVTLAASELSGWTNVVITIPVTTAFSVDADKRLQLKIQATGDTVDLAYDAAPYASYLQLPQQ